ncbi:MAG: Uma2 family endonuclease [Verrucomicrobiae bacterium]|nr:Uma2 family endonuclease [Verrucomicrobiae bacterium]
MSAVEKIIYLTEEEYLEGERHSEIRHELVGWQAWAMAGASEEHNTISLHLASALSAHLRGKRCRTFVADMKVRVNWQGAPTFFYPDVLVTYDPRDIERYFKQFPTVIIEVLSPDTERFDRREKLMAYASLDSLQEYVLVAQDKAEVTLHRRANGWKPEVISGITNSLELRSLEFSLPLTSVYEDVAV